MRQEQSTYKDHMKKEIYSLISAVLAHNCGGSSELGGKVKMQIPLAQVIDYKLEQNQKWFFGAKPNLEQSKFEAYLTATDNIIKDIKALFPFVDLTGIDLSWTGQDILDMIYKVYENIPIYNLEQMIEIAGPRKIKKTKIKKRSKI